MKYRFISSIMSMCVFGGMLSAFPVFAQDEQEEKIHYWDGTYDTGWYDSDETDFYLSTPEELAGYVELSNKGKMKPEQTIHLSNDIYLNNIEDAQSDLVSFLSNGKMPSYKSWKSLSNNYCSVDGDNHTIYGLYGNTFSAENHAIIKNISFQNSFIQNTASIVSGGHHDPFATGCIANYNYNVISGCIVSGVVISNVEYASHLTAFSAYCTSYTGGLVGMNYADISCCRNSATILASNGLNTDKTNRSPCFSGGICGGIFEQTVDNETEMSSPIQIEQCSNLGQFNVETELYNTLLDSRQPIIGGICGYIEEDTVLTNVYNKGDFIGWYDGIFAGIVGGCSSSVSDVKIQNAYNSGELIVHFKNIPNLNPRILERVSLEYFGIIGNSSIKIKNCYYQSSVASKGAPGDKDEIPAKSEKNMKKPEFAEALGDAFVAVEGDYPILVWEQALLSPSEFDVNGDGTFDKIDIELVRDYLIGVTELTEEQAKRADMDNDERITAKDLTLLKMQLFK